MSDIKEAVQQQFGNVAEEYRKSTVHASGEDLTQMVQIAGLNGIEHVLDAGCGAGHTALAFAPYASQVVAYDLTASMLEQVERLANERGVQNVTTRKGDVENLPFGDQIFDIVVS